MRLLVVEDEHSLREDIARKLRLSGYEVDACADGEAALEALAAERYDLVLLDLNLPKVDGMQVLRSLRRHDLETCVLILSARSEISDKVEGLDAGANDYLSKPFHLAELEARVRSLTRRKFIQQDVCLVMYNAQGTCYGGPGGGQINIVNNYYKAGPSHSLKRPSHQQQPAPHILQGLSLLPSPLSDPWLPVPSGLRLPW